MSLSHVYFNFDIKDRLDIWVRSFSRGNIQYHTKSSRIFEGMQARCAVEGAYKKRFTTYEDAASLFKDFQEFAEWCQTQSGYYGNDGSKNWCLDKDILVRGNKIYGPDTCVFVPEFVNVLFANKKATDLPFGVTRHLSKYRSRCNTFDGRVHLGCFFTKHDAHRAWQIAKVEHILKVAEVYLKLPESDLNVYNALIARAECIRNEALSGLETTVI